MQQTLPILSIDSSDGALGVDISLAGRSLCCKVIDEPRIHASMLMPTIIQALEESGRAFGDLGGVAVAKGPGSYTGLRIGVSSAKGLAYALGIPLIGVSTMYALAVAYREVGSGETLVTALSSRKNELYAQIWDLEDRIAPLTKLAAMSFAEVPSFLRSSGRRSFASAGGGSLDLQTAVSSSNDFSLTPAPGELAIQTVRGLAVLASEYFEQGIFEDVADFEPYYLKDFVAKKGASPFAAARNR